MPQSKHAGFPVFRRPLFSYGIKVLFDDTETDFVFGSPLPLVWQCSYYSEQIGNGWLGQGWSLPFFMRLVRTADGKVLKSSNNLSEEWTFDYRKDHTVVTDTYNTTATTPWHRYATGPTKTAKIANKPTTSTATKSASRARPAISSCTANTPPGVV